MRITLVSPFDPTAATSAADRFHVGGVERVFQDVSRQLAGRGHDVTLLTSTEDGPTEADEHGVHIVRRRRSGTLLGAPIVRLAKSIPPDSDLIHVAATYPFTTPAVLRRAYELGVPSVLDFHFEPTPASLLGRWAAYVYRRVGPPSYRFADAALVRSFSYARSAPSLAAVPEARWRVVPNGVDPEFFHPNGGNPSGSYLLFVGRLVPYKGVDVLIRALALQPLPLPLVIAGEGPCRAELEDLARRLGVNVRFLGRVHDDALPPLYRGACATVLPSVGRQEAFGICLLESMACGTPVVASDLPGVDEIALQGGLLARPGDPASLAALLERVEDPTAMPRGQLLASRIHRAFSWQAVTDRLVAVYSELLEPSGAPEAGVNPVAHPGRNPVL